MTEEPRARRQVSVWVDEEILRLFDEWAWGLRLSRTRAVEQVMGAAAKGGLSEGFGELGDPEVAADPARTVDQIESPDGTFTMSVLPAGGLASRTEAAEIESKHLWSSEQSTQREKKPKVIAELRERMEEVRAACTHPKDKVEKFSWGKRCGECGQVLK